MNQIYLAGPFFNPKQLAIIENIKECIEILDLRYFSPKDESMFKQGDDPKHILQLNCDAINDSDLVIVVTNDKDVGTIWEAGYAFAKGKQILYVWLDHDPKMKFNIMLAASGEVVHSYETLSSQLYNYRLTSMLIKTTNRDMLHE